MSVWKIEKGQIKSPSFDERQPYAFIQCIPYFEGTILTSMLGPVVVFIAWHFVANALIDLEYFGPVNIFWNDPEYVSNIQNTMNIFLSLTLGWKINKGLSNNGAGLFLKRTGNFRKLMKLSCNVPLKDYTPATVASVEASRKTIRRKSDILWAFFRQGVREQRVGFHPKSEMAKVPFNDDTFWQDPCRPYLSDLLTEEEKAKYAATPVKLRVAKVSREILQEAEELAMNLDPTLYNYYMQNMNVAMASIQAQYSGSSAVLPENGGAMPFVYQHMVLVLLWVFLLLTPFAARKAAEDKLDHAVVDCSGCMSCANTFMQAGCDQAAYTPTAQCKSCDKECAQNLLDMSSCSLSAAAAYSFDPYSLQGLLMVALLTICYFGVYEASNRLNNPWGWDRCDYNLEKTGLTIVKQGSRVMSTRITSESREFDGKGEGN